MNYSWLSPLQSENYYVGGGNRVPYGPNAPPPRIRPPESSITEAEASGYYARLPSNPRLVARTGSKTWGESKDGCFRGPGTKELSVVVNHKLNTIWEFQVAPKVQACLNELRVRWTSLDVVRISEIEDSRMTAIVLWIGVKPNSIDGDHARVSVFRCLDVLKEFDIDDVEVEMRESLVFRSAGLGKLFQPIYSSFLTRDPISDIEHPFTHSLGIPICPQDAPESLGTGGFFMSQGNDTDPILLVTARHVVFPPKKRSNDLFERTSSSQPRSNVLLLGDETAYASEFESLQSSIKGYEREIDDAKQRGAVDIKDMHLDPEYGRCPISRWEREKAALQVLLEKSKNNWATPDSYILGQVVYSPPITLGAGTPDEQFTEDYAIIEVDDGKIDRSKFDGNSVYVRTWDVSDLDYVKMMEVSGGSSTDNPAAELHTLDRNVKLDGIIPTSEMRSNPDIRVTKNSRTTKTTFGRANCIMSFVREYSDFDDSYSTSKEWPILPYDYYHPIFSDWGDSGAVVVDGLGRIGGLLTGGAGISHGVSELWGWKVGRVEPRFDITYVAPIEFLLKSIKARYPDAHLI
ncbi:hypothetical protein BDY19DRAFT_962251 [Irpex rosettiformis]|uniref:Uncharacterized protein n=1 Tax=Irpex rosettiformis TaxID=378272 RepID=A0ACB8TWS8_9APHY|nr:hypothetical protein BDY19DRAFT_962251 [Irpex rosettiformis]